MSELIKHECGIAMVRLLKPLDYYEQKYGTPLWGFNQLFLLMEKQHNRGQDGAGIGCVKLDMPAGDAYMFRDREIKRNPLDRMFSKHLGFYQKMVREGTIMPEIARTVKDHFDFGGEVLLGHLRYGTSGDFGKNSLHPYVRRSNWTTRNLMLAGNFNMTNLEELNAQLIQRGQHPIFGTDTQTVLEGIGYHLDESHDAIYRQMKARGEDPQSIPDIISEQLDPVEVLQASAPDWDGGYAIAGLIGNGDAFVLRDPHGIRPCSYIVHEDYIAFASERVALMTIFGVEQDQVRELEPAEAAVIKASGEFYTKPFLEASKRTSCSFERIYFSRGNDPEIYLERKHLGALLCDQINQITGGDVEHTVFSYIPNTAETAYYGMVDGMRQYRRKVIKEQILEASQAGSLDAKLLDELFSVGPRSEKIAHKDIKLRTFISQEKNRTQMASHVYDITYGLVKPEDTLVCIDDSIVRGTTLRQSILRILARTNPKAIVIASTAPQIRYPDCYGIDMSELGKFIAFQASVELLKDQGRADLLREIYEDCIKQQDLPVNQLVNHVKRIYDGFSAEEVSRKITEIVTPREIDWKGRIHIIYQSIDNLHKALPGHSGDWYFTGNYPTPGGLAVLNRAYINFYEKKTGRSY